MFLPCFQHQRTIVTYVQWFKNDAREDKFRFHFCF